MSMPAAKRRRIDAATSILSRPFKSPLKQDLAQDKEEKEETHNIEDLGEPCTIRASNSSPAVPRTRVFRPYPQSLSSPVKDSPYNTLLKEQRRLERELRDARSDLDTHEQALKIESNGKDEELEQLIEKWKGVSRNAADEMFSKVQDRINRMGGPAAWREMQKTQSEWKQGGFEEPLKPAAENDVDGEHDPSERRDLYAEYEVDPEYVGEAKADPTDEESDTFTIDMMLKSINVDLKAIGYDKQQQRWSD